MLTRVLYRSLGQGWGGHPQGEAGDEPPLRAGRSCCAACAFLFRLPPCTAEAPALARLPLALPAFRERCASARGALPAGETPAPDCAPRPTSPRGRAPHAAPPSSQPSRRSAPSRARPRPGAGCVRPATSEGTAKRGVGPQWSRPRRCTPSSQKPGIGTTQAPFDPPLDLPLSQLRGLSLRELLSCGLPPERFPPKPTAQREPLNTQGNCISACRTACPRSHSRIG